MPAETSDCCGVCCPYNGLFAIPLTLVILAHVLFNVAALGCRTFKLEQPGFATFYTGYWTFEDKYNECSSLDDTLDDVGVDVDWDAPWKVGRAVSVVGSVVSYGVVIMLLVNSCVRYPKVVFNVMAGTMFLMAALSVLLLVGLAAEGAKEDGVQIGPGGVVAIVACCLYIGAGVSMFFCMKERNLQNLSGFQDQQAAAQPHKSAYTTPTYPGVPLQTAVPQDIASGNVFVEVHIIEHPDGTKSKTTTKTTTMPDGSKQVVKTEEELEQI